MSHIETGSTTLAFADLPALISRGDAAALAHHPCIALMRQAVALVAKQYDGKMKSYYYEYDYQEQPANTGLALHIPRSAARPHNHALPRGIGLVIDQTTGMLTFVGDLYKVNKDFYQQVQHQIVQKYTVLAHMAALTQMHYRVSTQEIEDHITITGVTYA